MEVRHPHYLQEGEYRVNSELKRLMEEIPESNSEYALGYKRFLELNNRKQKTIARRLEELRYVLRLIEQDAKKATKQDIERVVMAINKAKRRDSRGKETEAYLASITKGKLKLTLKTFYKWLFEAEQYPDCVKWIKIDSENRYKLPEEMLSEDEIKFLIANCRNQRDKTIIALLWDTGMRVGELLNLRMKDVSLTENISHVRVSGKTGDRQVPLVFSVPYFARYVNDYRTNANPDSPLFTTIEHNTVSERAIDYVHVTKLLKDLKRRTKTSKRLYPHLFRHSRATHYANSLTEQQAKMYFGWAGSSNMVARYTHLSGRDIDDAVLKANGMPTNHKKGSEVQVKMCIKCHERNEITAKYCVKCGTPLNITQITQVENVDDVKKELTMLKVAFNLLMSKLDEDTRNKVVDVVKRNV